jgi:hypothetical protein
VRCYLDTHPPTETLPQIANRLGVPVSRLLAILRITVDLASPLEAGHAPMVVPAQWR